jgi:hypothetical protein
VEFEAAEEGRELEVLAHLLRKATADVFRARLAGVDLSGLQGRFDEGATVETGDLVPPPSLLAGLGTVPGLAAILSRLGVEEESPGPRRRRARAGPGGAAPQPPAGQGRGRRPDRLRRLTWSPTCTRPPRTRRTCAGASCSPALVTLASFFVLGLPGDRDRRPPWLLLPALLIVLVLVVRPLMAPVLAANRLRRRLAYQAFLESREDERD